MDCIARAVTMTAARIMKIPKSTAGMLLNECPLVRVSLISLIITFSSCRFAWGLVGNENWLEVMNYREEKKLGSFYFPKLRAIWTMSRMSIRLSLLTSAFGLYRGDPGEVLKAAIATLTSFISTFPS
jgi:hypothetical protein